MTVTRLRSATTVPPNPVAATGQCRCRHMINGQLQPAGQPVLVATFPNQHLDPTTWQRPDRRPTAPSEGS